MKKILPVLIIFGLSHMTTIMAASKYQDIDTAQAQPMKSLSFAERFRLWMEERELQKRLEAEEKQLKIAQKEEQKEFEADLRQLQVEHKRGSETLKVEQTAEFTALKAEQKRLLALQKDIERQQRKVAKELETLHGNAMYSKKIADHRSLLKDAAPHDDDDEVLY